MNNKYFSHGDIIKIKQYKHTGLFECNKNINFVRKTHTDEHFIYLQCLEDEVMIATFPRAPSLHKLVSVTEQRIYLVYDNHNENQSHFCKV